MGKARKLLNLIESLGKEDWLNLIVAKAKDLDEDDFIKWFDDEINFKLFRKDRKLYYEVEKELKNKYGSAVGQYIWRAINNVNLEVYKKGKITVTALSTKVLNKIDAEGKKIIKKLFDFIQKKYPRQKLNVTIGLQPVSVAGGDGFRMGVPIEHETNMWFIYDNRTLKDWKKLEDKFGPRWVSTAYDVFHELSHVLGINDEKKADRNALKLAKEFFKS